MEGSAVDWELVKENFQPLKSGRKTPALAAAEEPAKLRASRAEEQKRFFCDRIASYKGDDPIEAWLKFIQWTQETYKAGGPQAELISLLERCTRELQSIPKYKSDIRYLRVWIHYANLLPEPQDVFHFLKENGIGQEFALYYLAYATYLELRGNFSRADATFQAGLSRHAQPEAKLRAKCEEFQQRMARRIQRKAEEQALGIGCESEGGEIAARPALGALPAASGNRRPAQASGLPRPLKRRPGLAVKEINTGRSGLEVFVDEEFAPSGGPALSSPRVARANDDGLAGEGKWAQLETWEQGRKENVQAPSKWAGAKLKQKKRLVAPAAPPLDIPQDEELAELGGNPSHVHATPKATLRKKLDGHSEALLKDPLRLHRETAKASHQEAETSSQARQLAAPAAPESRRGLQLPGNALHTKQPTGCTPAALGYAPSHAAGGEDVTMATKEAFAAVNSMFGGIMPCYGSGVYREVEPTVTISTKAAFEALNSMFSGSLPHEQQAQREVRETLHATGQLPPRPQRPRARGLSTNQPPAPAGTTLGHPVTNEGGTSFHADAANPSSPAPIGVYEDTGLLTTDTKAPGMVARGAAQSGAEARGSMPGDGLATGVEETGGLLVYEDTALLGGTGQRSSGFMGTAGGDADETQGFVLYEDTALLQPPASPAGSCQEEQGICLEKLPS
ncbi:hypothetical protein WJX84_012354 [Apatococcus fuscideae]|uniref:BUB1 N-terminal domain-containing protein n=1 Tax=Apatococcus fuscideae TaxID=2026836 RepID=A0AAW1SWP2_9CHLO